MDSDPDRRADLRATYLFLGCALLVLPFSEGVFGLPLKALLKDQLHVKPLALAIFMSVSGFGWGTKLIAGLLTDRVPLFGTRRRHYLLISLGVAAAGAALMAAAPLDFVSLLLAHVVLNVGVVFATVAGYGLMVEKGQRYNVTGDFSALQLVAGGAAGLLVGPVAGFLAGRPLVWASALSAASLGLLLAVAWHTVREKRIAPADSAPHREPLIGYLQRAAEDEWRTLISSRALQAVAAMLFLFCLSPGVAGTLLYYHQTDRLGFSPQLIGNLDAVTAAAALTGGALYPLLSRRFRVGRLLVAGIVLSALSALLYLFYATPASAAAVSAVHGIVGGTLAVLPLYDLAARAAPRAGAALGYSLILSVQHIAGALSDWLGAALYQHLHVGFDALVWINAATTLLALAVLPLLPKGLLRLREGEAGSDDGEAVAAR